MSCQPFQAAILDEQLPRPQGLDQHLSSCPWCQELSSAHLAALTLRGLIPGTHPRARPSAVLSRLGVAAALLLLLAGVATWWTSRQRAVPAVPSAEVFTEAHAAWLVLWAEQDLAALDAERDLLERDRAYAPFGRLAQWMSPTRSKKEN